MTLSFGAMGRTNDLHPGVSGAGTVVCTPLAKTGVIRHRTSDKPSFEIYVHRSFADYAWRWLEDAGLEYNVPIAVS
ncbi:MAG: hypothetical protein O7I42_07795 [Alphaproteobacteria bacterium]|nr:hypothetical protein [Alphaproteobacteria bacterium]